MIPRKLHDLITAEGKLEKYPVEHVFHSQGFQDMLFMLKSGYVKRYQVGLDDKRVIELIYGPGHIFPLSQLYRRLYGIEQNQPNLVYVYQSMTDIEIYSLDDNVVLEYLEKDATLFKDLHYESGIRLASNIQRLASNALSDDYQKVAHQLVCLAEEFGERNNEDDSSLLTKISVPLRPIDMAEQLNISAEVAEAVMASLVKRELIAISDNIVTIPNLNALKDVYLQNP